MAFTVSERRSPTVHGCVLDQLRVSPGPVNDVYMVAATACHHPDGIFKAMHTVVSVLKKPVTFAINGSQEAQLFIRCTDTHEAEAMDAARVAFKFDHNYIRFYKLVAISRLPAQEDSASIELHKTFAAFHEHMNSLFTGYPRGYSDFGDDLELIKNPALSATAMKILGVEEGPVTDVVHAVIKYQRSPQDYMVALRGVTFQCRFKFVVDQDEGLYLRFEEEHHAEIQCIFHKPCLGKLTKFYRVETVKKRERWEDKTVMSRVCSRAEGQRGRIVWETIY